MTREEAIEELERLLRHWDLIDEGIYDLSEHDQDAVEFAISALRSVSREGVEKAWNGCINCHDKEKLAKHIHCWPSFCPVCGRPLTDEAVEIVMERLEALHDNRT